MAAINVAKYQTIADLYANAQKRVAGVVTYYFDAAYEIVLLQVFDPELDLLSPFYNAYLAARTAYSTAPESAITAVQRLQTHVLNRARDSAGTVYTDINDWIDADGSNGSNTAGLVSGRQGDVNTAIKVEQEFADMSSSAGYAIDVENIG